MDYTTRVLSKPPAHDQILVDADKPERTVLWEEYVSLVKHIAAALLTLGVADQDGVGLLSYNDIYYYILGDGAVAAGAVFAPIPTFVRQAELVRAITAAGLQWIFVSSEFLDLTLSAASSVGIPAERVLVFDPPGWEVYAGSHISLSKLLASTYPTGFRNANLGSDVATRIAFRLFTSGTTGSVKAAEISHAAQLERMSGIGIPPVPNTRALQTIGMYHVSGLYAFNRAVCGSVPLYVSGADDAATILERIKSLGITDTMISPRLMEDIIAASASGTRTSDHLASLRAILFGGAPIRQETVEKFRALMCADALLIAGYASTESGTISWGSVDAQWTTGVIGTIATAVEVKIVNPETLEQVPMGTMGEVCTRSAQAFIGYYNDAAATTAAFLPGGKEWFRTGDKGCISQSSHQLTLTGRYKQIFKVRYEEVAPAEVEHELLRHPAIAQAHVTETEARDNPKDRECMAYIVRKPGAQLTAQEVVDFIASRLSPHKAPTGAVVFTAQIPGGAMGKVTKSGLPDVQALAGSARFLSIGV